MANGLVASKSPAPPLQLPRREMVMPDPIRDGTRIAYSLLAAAIVGGVVAVLMALGVIR